jgi:hypothetical protein
MILKKNYLILLQSLSCLAVILSEQDNPVRNKEGIKGRRKEERV